MIGTPYHLNCVNSCTVNTFKNICQLNWNRKQLNYVICDSRRDSRVWLSFKPVLAHASCVSSTLLASVKSVKKTWFITVTIFNSAVVFSGSTTVMTMRALASV